MLNLKRKVGIKRLDNNKDLPQPHQLLFLPLNHSRLSQSAGFERWYRPHQVAKISFEVNLLSAKAKNSFDLHCSTRTVLRTHLKVTSLSLSVNEHFMDYRSKETTMMIQ